MIIDRITEENLIDAMNILAQTDKDMACALAEAGPPPLRAHRADFAALLRAIIAQQISLASAQAVWDRLKVICPRLEPADIAALPVEDLRKAGLSRQKCTYAHSLAHMFESGAINLARLHDLSDEEAVAMLTQAKGIGRWSAEVFLLFSCGRPDLLPVDDVGLMIGMQKMKHLPSRPTPKEMDELSQGWRPLRSAAARMLWHYRAVKPAPKGSLA